MNWDGRIAVKPGIMMGKHVIKGTRITVEIILERLNAGETVEQIANSYKNNRHPRCSCCSKKKIRIKRMD